MRKAVLIIAPVDDAHALALASVLDSDFGTPAVIWDRGTLPLESRLDFQLDESVRAMRLAGPAGSHDLSDFHSIWWRRPATFRIDKAVTDYKIRSFCQAECAAFFSGVLRSLQIPIINNPFAESVATKKPYQLAMAHEVGLDIPKTLMSNNPDSIRDFWAELEGRCIYKPFTAPSWTFSETRELREKDLDHLKTLCHAPIIVQEKIDKGLDVRVNIFGEAVFAAAVTTHIPEADLDWRVDQTAEWHNHDLPAPIGRKLKALLRALQLHTGCIDLRQQPNGAYRFLEVNPSGQFLFAEIDTGKPLLQSLAELLVNPPRAGVRSGYTPSRPP
jgi:glutathione synthase/RimK-type ligase-like ATP-grasp enzyme